MLEVFSDFQLMECWIEKCKIETYKIIPISVFVLGVWQDGIWAPDSRLAWATGSTRLQLMIGWQGHTV